MNEFVLLVDWPLESIWGTAVGFVAFFVLAVGLIGIISKSLAIPIYGAYMAFAYFATTANIPVLEPVLYVTLVLVIVGTAFKLVRLEGVDGI